MASPELSYEERLIVDSIKKGHAVFSGDQRVRKTLCMSVAISEMALERGGITFYDVVTKESYHVPAGTPWQEALPIRIND